MVVPIASPVMPAPSVAPIEAGAVTDSQSRTFYNRDRFYRGEHARSDYNHIERTPQPSSGDRERAQGDYNRAERTPQPSGRESEGARGVENRPAQRPGLLKETTTLLEDTPNLAVRAASARCAFSNYDHGGQERSFSIPLGPQRSPQIRPTAVGGKPAKGDGPEQGVFIGALQPPATRSYRPVPKS
jgi:hypothetical protein